MNKSHVLEYSLTTEELARIAQVKPQTVVVRLCVAGNFHGLTPRKLPNGRLTWPSNSQELLFEYAQQKAAARKAAKANGRTPRPATAHRPKPKIRPKQSAAKEASQ